MTTTAAPAYELRDRDLLLQAEDTSSYVLRVRDLPDADKPRERLLAAGPGELSVAELLAIIWGVGTKSEDVLAMAKRTLKEYGSKAIAHETDPAKLAEAANIPVGKASQVVASFELGRRYHSTAGGRAVYIRNARQAHAYLRDIATSQKEQLRGLYLNSRYRVIHEEVISVGSLTASIVHPREVFQPAIEHGAVAIILAHNHPSGAIEPTIADINITDQLVDAGLLLGIELLDHLVVTNTRFQSILGLPKYER